MSPFKRNYKKSNFLFINTLFMKIVITAREPRYGIDSCASMKKHAALAVMLMPH